MEVYPIRERWRKFRRHLAHPDVRAVENAAMRSMHPEYEAGRHIPREAGRCLDVPAPRSRTGATAYQCFGFCHTIAPVMLALAKLAEPDERWLIVSAIKHTAVVSEIGQGEYRYLLDINMVGYPDDHTLEHFREKVLGAAYYTAWWSPEAYIESYGAHFRSQYPMRPEANGREPEPGAAALYEGA